MKSCIFDLKNNTIERFDLRSHRKPSLLNIRMMLNSYLAKLYEVETKRINEAVKNNPEQFPEDFYFELTSNEFNILRSKFSTAKFAKTRTLPKVFTEQGVDMLATVLKSQVALDVKSM